MTIVTTLLLATFVSQASPQIGDPTPIFTGRTITGATLRTRDLLGQNTVVEFFASYCLPCQESLADLLEIQRQIKPPFRLVLVAVEGDVPALRAYLAQRHLPESVSVLLDQEGRLATAFGENRLPTSYFLDEHAVIRHINRGHGPGFLARATRWLRELPGK